MVRHVIVGNQSMLVNFDETLCMRDLFFPHVGMENHVLGTRQRIGVFTDHMSWIDESGWNRCLQCDTSTLISNSEIDNPAQGVGLDFKTFVDAKTNILFRKITVKNHFDHRRRIGVFFHHDFNFYGDGIGDTAGYDPVRKAIFSYQRNRYVFMCAATDDELREQSAGISSYTINSDPQQSWHDAQDGSLQRNPIGQGNVNSCFAKRVEVPAHGETTFWFWLCADKSFTEVHKMHDDILQYGPQAYLTRTSQAIEKWSEIELPSTADLSEDHKELYRRSLLVIRAHTDKDGAILAGNDSDNMLFNRDTYSYMWPRDGALVSIALNRAGKMDLTEQFFRYASELLYEEGCFLHKYNPDGSLGSTWQAWIRNGEPFLPIQEDETALMLYALWIHHEKYKEDQELFHELYDSFIVPAANFLMQWWDDELGAVKESWDLWEERICISAWTCAAKYAGLKAAAKFAHLRDDVREQAFESRADDVHRFFEKYLFNEELGRFVSRATIMGEEIVQDLELDVSIMGLFLFDMFSHEDTRMQKTMEDVEKALWIPTSVGGLARNEHDYYHYAGDDFKTIKGNPWILTTLWLAKWRCARAQSREELSSAKELLDWVLHHKLPTGMLAEQLHPFTGEGIGVCPLTWSHAEYVDTVHWYIDAWSRLG